MGVDFGYNYEFISRRMTQRFRRISLRRANDNQLRSISFATSPPVSSSVAERNAMERQRCIENKGENKKS